MSTGATELRERREAAGLSQQALAVAIGKHTASISQYERGVQHPRRNTAQALDDALDAGGALLDAFGFSRSDESAEIQMFRAQALTEMARQAELLEQVRAGARADVEILQDVVLDLQRRLEALEQRGHGSV